MRSRIAIIVSLWSVFIFGQSNSTYLPKTIPSSPETAKFNQFIDTPVGYNTGMPNININLGEISIDGVNIPISLSYHPDGIKVDEKATWVGLGWNLDAGYKISRKENGLPDESRFFWQTDSNSLGSIQGIKNYSDNNPFSNVVAENLANAQDKNNPNIDLRPDEFNYSTASSNAKFLFSQQNQKFITFPLNMDKIVVDYQTNKINNIKIIDDQGVKYFYGIEDSAKERTNPLIHNFYNTWNISKIENIKNEIISFTYNLHSLQNYEKPISNLQGLNTFISNDQLINLESSYISEINYPEGKIEFVTETNREDLKQFPKLHSIVFKNNINQVIKTIVFNYSYFTNNSGTTSSDNFTENSGKRLKLNSIDIYNNINSEKQTYSFSYYENNIPDRLIGGSDYWGYYNGSTGNNIPSYVKYGTNPVLTNVEDPDIMVGYYSGANKNINPQTFNAFLLKDINYPTGAKQEYVYETNFGKLSNNKDQVYFCLANKYLPINQNLTNYYFSISGLFGQNYADGINFGYPLPTQTIALNQNEKKYIFRKSFPINSGNVKSTGTLYTNSLSHNFNKTLLGVTNSSLLNMNIEEKRYLIKNGVKTLIYEQSTVNTSLVGNEKPIFFYSQNLLIDDYDTFEIEISIIYNNLITPQLNNIPFYFNYNFDDVKRDTNQPYNNNVFMIGGARVKEIYSKDNNSQIKKRVYKFSDDFSESGLAYFVPNFSERRIKYLLLNNSCGAPCGFTPITYWSISSQGIYNTSNGSNVAYQNIEEQIYGSDNSYLGKISYEYYLSILSSDNNFISFQSHPYSFINTHDWVNKSLKTKKIFKADDNTNPIIREDYDYFFKKTITPASVDEIRNDLINDDIIQIEGKDCLNSIFFPYNYLTKSLPYFKHFVGFSLPKTKITTEYFSGNPVINTITYNYNFTGDYLQLINQSTISSTNQNLETKYYYSNDLPQETGMVNMVSANRIGEPIRTENYINGIKLSQKDIKYGLFPSDIVAEDLILPQYIYEGKENSSEKKITFNSYDTKGNITQYTIESGTVVSLIWGYNKTQPIAKIENATNLQVETALGMNLSAVTEANMNSINNLRASLPNAMVTTYTYIPLVGVHTITDPKGDTITYQYDSFGRLSSVKDRNGNTLSENQYNYRTQN